MCCVGGGYGSGNFKLPCAILIGVQRLKLLKKKYWETKGSSLMCPASLHYSNVNLLDPTLGVPTRVGTGYLDDGTKVTDTRALARTRQRRPFPHYSRVQMHHDPLPSPPPSH